MVPTKKGGLTMDRKSALASEIARLYKEKHGVEMYCAALWGASQVFLSEKDLEILLDYAQQKSKENN